MEHGAEPVWHRLARQRLNPAAAAPLVPDDAGAAPDAALLAANAAPLEADAAGAGPPAAGAAADGGEMAAVAAADEAAV